jgi:hypothetical protein
MARVTSGRLVRPSNLAERRLLLSLGIVVLRVPRRTNPYLVARRLERAARCGDDVVLLRSLVRPAAGLDPQGSNDAQGPADDRS